jgi:uncharacterized protein (DUF1015 family)
VPQILPFHGYRYNAAKIKKYDDVLSPPYDVISAKEQAALYAKSPYNFVRVDLSKKVTGQDAYRATAAEISGWIAADVLKRDEAPTIYVYDQQYKNLVGKPASRVGFVSLMRIDQSKVKKHEYTLAGPKVDRTALMETLQAQLSPIFGMFRDPKGSAHKELKRLAKAKPAIDVTVSGVRHRFYPVTDAKAIAKIAKAVGPQNMYIADGHHRFEVASEFYKRHPKQKVGGKGLVLTYMCDAFRNDFTIYPTHRILKGLEGNWKGLIEKVTTKHFKIEKAASLNALVAAIEKKPKGGLTIGMVCCGGYSKLTLKAKTRDLDVTVLQKLLISKLLGEEVAKSDKIRFTRDPKEADAAVQKDGADVSFILPYMPVSEMMRVSDLGIRLPQKSTYFYPKLLSGLVVYKF